MVFHANPQPTRVSPKVTPAPLLNVGRVQVLHAFFYVYKYGTKVVGYTTRNGNVRKMKGTYNNIIDQISDLKLYKGRLENEKI